MSRAFLRVRECFGRLLGWGFGMLLFVGQSGVSTGLGAFLGAFFRGRLRELTFSEF